MYLLHRNIIVPMTYYQKMNNNSLTSDCLESTTRVSVESTAYLININPYFSFIYLFVTIANDTRT